ncbi:hypothetical protein Pint_17999 [Pistacia integerrima]|uniref:Uncharacterized protein n=1 Tax=Pistacia integerrima TaxID=434235 RepID=A0ACC0YYR6_9ROSI|nr:hypothetical protein Pint_17999 [Pistacia integerrima]
MFQWVTEMNVIGLHSQFLSGIDYLKIDGKVIAVSVVASGRYSNNVNYSDVLVYSGQGENPALKRKQQLEDQKLERGNLALKNSMEEKTPVRVVRMSGRRISNKVYFYDGLYLVDRYWQERGKFGKLVFMFWLKRIEGQPKCTFWEKCEI